MLFERKFVPDFFFSDIYAITSDFLRAQNIRGIVSDIDNTLITYDETVPSEKLLKWFEMLRENNVQIAFASNNLPPRIEQFAKGLRCFAAANSHKPRTQQLRAAMKYMGTDTGNTVMLGDQLFTDVWAGKSAHLRTIIVAPIKDKTTLLMRFQRKLERPYVVLAKKKGVLT